jgi:hypothetical protein
VPRRLVAVLAVPLLAAACGGSKSGSPGTTSTSGAADAVSAAVAKTITAGSEHVAITASTTAAGQHVTLSGAGDFDSAKRQGKLTTNVSLSGVKTQLDEVLTGTTVYIRSQLFGSFLPAGKSWLKIDLKAAGKAIGIDSAVLGAQDPAQALAQLKAITGLEDLGTATVGGVSTTHYRGTIDTSKLPAAAASALSRAKASLGPYDLWVGEDGYVHRVKVTTKASTGTGTVGKTVLTMTLSKFGESVSVSVPSASQTVDASKLSIPGLSG